MYLVISYTLTLLILLLCRASHSAKLKTPLRALHSRSVVSSIVFGASAVFLFAQILQLVDWLININFIRNLIFSAMPSANSSGAFFWIVTLVSSLIISLAFLIFIYLIYALWLLPASKKAFKKSKNPVAIIFNWISSKFYDMYDSRAEIKPYAHNIGHWMRYIRNIFAVLIIAEAVVIPLYIHFELLVIDDNTFSLLVKSLFMIPVVSYFILDQIVIMLQADPKESNIKLETEDIKKKHVGDYSKFIEIFESLFAGEALISYYINDKEEMRNSTFSGPSNEHIENADNPELLCAVCRNVSNVVSQLSPNYVDALVDLVNKDNIIVMDSFFGEFTLYYLSYLQHFLFLRKKALIVVSSDNQVKQVVTQYEKIFLHINKVYPIWKICDFSNMPDEPLDADILVCTEDQLFDIRRTEKYTSFMNEVSNVVVFDVYKTICRENLFTLSLMDELSRRKAQFVFFATENNPDILRAVKESLGCSDIHLYSNFNESANTCIMCWRGESVYKTQASISQDLHNDFGVAYTISAIAASYDVSSVNIHAHTETIPVNTYSLIAKGYARELAKSLFYTDGIRLESVVNINPLVAFETRDLSFDILYDRDNNLANVVRMSLSDCAFVTSMVHVVSRPYMLRDYFAYHIDTLSKDSVGIMSVVPNITGDLYAPSLVLIIRLREVGMTCEEIINYMNAFGEEVSDVETVLSNAIYKVLGSDISDSVYNFFSFGNEEIALFSNDDYKYTRKIVLTNERVYLEAKEKLGNIVNLIGDCEGVLPIGREVVYNHFVPGQTMVYSGRRYFIKSINDGTIKVQLEETVEKEKEYTNYYDISISDLQEPYDHLMDNAVSCEIFRANVSRSINGYFSHYNGLDFNSKNKNTVEHKLSSPIMEKKNVACMRLRIKFPFGENFDSAAILMLVLVRGLLETVLPRNYKDIMVVSKIDSDITEKYYFEADEDSSKRNDPIPSDWLEQEDYEEPLSPKIMKLFPSPCGDSILGNSEEEINLYFIEFNESDSSILEALMNEMKEMLSVLRRYMEWIIENPRLPHSYLKFGYNLLPDIFNTELVNDCLQRVAEKTDYDEKKLVGVLKISDPKNVAGCSFCGRPLGISHWEFDDNRVMCEECSKHCATERKEIEVLLKKACETLEGMYGITLPEGIKIKFKSASSIRKEQNIYSPDSRIIGLYVPSKREIWIERGGPEACVLSTLMHELTHAWQFDNIDADRLDLMYIEGHSTYVEIECMRKLSQNVYADFWEKRVESSNDEYSRGLLYWRNRLRSESDKNIFHHIASM